MKSAAGEINGASESQRYFLNFRMYATKALTSSSETPSAGFIRILPSLSFRPSFMVLAAASSFSSAWTLASVKSLMPSFWPILVWPFPSSPWHLAQLALYFSAMSAAFAENATDNARTTATMSSFFIRFFGWFFVMFILSELRDPGSRRKQSHPEYSIWTTQCQLQFKIGFP